MTPTVVLPVIIGGLYAAGVYLLLDRSLTRVLLGFLLLGNATNLLLLSTGGAGGMAPILGYAEAEEMSDPLPQALILTAIVITFGVAAFVLAMIHRSWALARNEAVGTDEEDRRVAGRVDTDADDVAAAVLQPPGGLTHRVGDAVQHTQHQVVERDGAQQHVVRPAPAVGGVHHLRRHVDPDRRGVELQVGLDVPAQRLVEETGAAVQRILERAVGPPLLLRALEQHVAQQRLDVDDGDPLADPDEVHPLGRRRPDLDVVRHHEVPGDARAHGPGAHDADPPGRRGPAPVRRRSVHGADPTRRPRARTRAARGASSTPCAGDAGA